MKKIVEDYTMDKVFDIINKHREIFNSLLNNAMVKKNMAEILLGEDAIDIIEKCERDMLDYASALATLELLERELKGEMEY